MILIVGPIPPPVHGAAVITEHVVETLAAQNIRAEGCSTSPHPDARGLRYHLSRLAAYLTCYARILTSNQIETVYISLSGGWGLIYDFFVVATARLKRCDLILHHHTFHYIVRPSPVLRAIVRIAGTRQRHIALCPTMALRIADIYGARLKQDVISNLTFFDLPQTPCRAAAGPLRVLGYLSAVSFDKGVDRFLDLMAALRAKGSQVTGLIAGPCADQAVKDYVERRVREIGSVKYLGAVYGDDKDAFLSSIDVLIFPSRLNEAQPLVIFEAQAAGAIVAATGQGCVPEMRGGPASVFVLNPEISVLDPLVERITAWEREPRRFGDEVIQARAEFEVLLTQKTADFQRFLALFAEPR
jgi:glycosyltransferase involved in cell wall biosynthesis